MQLCHAWKIPVVAKSRRCEERFLRRSNPGLDFYSNVKTWIASSQLPGLYTLRVYSGLPRFIRH